MKKCSMKGLIKYIFIKILINKDTHLKQKLTTNTHSQKVPNTFFFLKHAIIFWHIINIYVFSNRMIYKYV